MYSMNSLILFERVRKSGFENILSEVVGQLVLLTTRHEFVFYRLQKNRIGNKIY